MIDPIAHIEPPLPSNRSFGFFFTAVFSAAGILAIWRTAIFWAALFWLLACVFGVLAAAWPMLLEPLNRIWYGVGVLLGKIVSPIVLGVIFFLLITPVSLVGRALGRDPLRLKRRNVASYWIDRSPPGPPSDSFKNQY